MTSCYFQVWRDIQVNIGRHGSLEQRLTSRNCHRNQCWSKKTWAVIDINPAVSVITLNINILSASVQGGGHSSVIQHVNMHDIPGSIPSPSIWKKKKNSNNDWKYKSITRGSIVLFFNLQTTFSVISGVNKRSVLMGTHPYLSQISWHFVLGKTRDCPKDSFLST